VSAGESGDAARGRKVPLGTGKFQALGRRRRERARGREGEARRGQWNGVGDGPGCATATPREGGREDRGLV